MNGLFKVVYSDNDVYQHIVSQSAVIMTDPDGDSFVQCMCGDYAVQYPTQAIDMESWPSYDVPGVCPWCVANMMAAKRDAEFDIALAQAEAYMMESSGW